MALFGVALEPADIYMIGSVLKMVRDLVAMKTGKEISIDDLPELMRQEEVRKAVLAAERNAAVADFLADIE